MYATADVSCRLASWAAIEQYQSENDGPRPSNSVTINGHVIAVQMTLARLRAILFGNILSREESEQLIALSTSR